MRNPRSRARRWPVVVAVSALVAGAMGGGFVAGRSIERRHAEHVFDERHRLLVSRSPSGSLIDDMALLEEVHRLWVESVTPPDGEVTAEWAGRVDGARAVLLTGDRTNTKGFSNRVAATFVEYDHGGGDKGWDMVVGPRGRAEGPVAIGYHRDTSGEAQYMLVPPEVHDVGLAPEEAARLHDDADWPGWSDHDATLLRAIDELHTLHRLADETWAGLAGAYDDPQLIEVLMLIRHYHMISLVANTLGVDLEADPYAVIPRDVRNSMRGAIDR